MPGTGQRISQNLDETAAHCVNLKQDLGVTIALALKPEPCCNRRVTACLRSKLDIGNPRHWVRGLRLNSLFKRSTGQSSGLHHGSYHGSHPV
jgi:hypothetical protein